MWGESNERARERLLDRCIDALLEGRSWEAELSASPQHSGELEPLVKVAADFLAASRQVPGSSPRRRARLWRRLVGIVAGMRAARTSRAYVVTGVRSTALLLASLFGAVG